MKIRKFMIGFATAAIVTPLPTLMSGCTQQTNILNRNQNNNFCCSNKNEGGIILSINQDISYEDCNVTTDIWEWTDPETDFIDYFYCDNTHFVVGNVVAVEFVGWMKDTQQLYWKRTAPIHEHGYFKTGICIDKAAFTHTNKIVIYVDDVAPINQKVTAVNKFTTLSNETFITGMDYETTINIPNDNEWRFKTENPIRITCGDQVIIPDQIERVSNSCYFIKLDWETQGTMLRDISIDAAIEKVDTPIGAKDLTIYFENKSFYAKLEKALPTECEGCLFKFTLPNEISDHHKTFDEQHIGYWKYENSEEKYDLLFDPANQKVCIDFAKTHETGPSNNVCVHIGLKNSNTESDISHCSWSDFLFWHNLCGQNNLSDFKEMFDLNVEDDSLLGVERTVTWDGVKHKVRIIDTNENFENHHSVPKANNDDTEIIGNDEHPENRDKADLVFQFAELLTKSNSDVATTKFHADESPDHNLNCWCSYIYDDKPHDQSALRSFLRNKDKFFNKFEDKELLDAIVPICNRRYTSTADTRKCYIANWVKDKFFVASARQMGIPKWTSGWKYICEGQEDTEPIEVYPFAYWNNSDKEKRRMYTTAGSNEQYWVASPSHEGSGLFLIENTIYIAFDGSFTHCNMTKNKAILPCFCL